MMRFILKFEAEHDDTGIVLTNREPVMVSNWSAVNTDCRPKHL